MSVSLSIYPFHAVTSLFPAMSEEEYQALRADIEQHGLREPLWTYEGQIIDGRHRARACAEVGLEPATRAWEGSGSLVAFVASLNFQRRHLSSSQRATLALALERAAASEAREHMSAGGGAGLERFLNPVQVPVHAAQEAARLAGTNAHYITDAKKIVAQAPELEAVMLAGTLSIPEAKTLAPLPLSQRVEAVQMLRQGVVKTAKGAVLEMKKAEREAQMQASPSRPTIVHTAWEDWLADQPLCDLLLTDPPYGTYIEDIEAFAQTWLPQALAKVRPTGRAYVFIGKEPRDLHAYQQVRTPWPVKQILTWHYKNTLGPAPTYDYKHSSQAFLYFRGADAPPLQVAHLTEQWDVMEINAPDGRLGNRYHAWQKPDELAERLIRQSTQKGDTVLDCFAGTGTFLLAAHRLGRVALGCEISEEMIEHAEKRGCVRALMPR